MTSNDPRSENAAPVETPVQARQGFLDRPVLMVLVVAVILAAIGLVIAYGVI